MKKKYTNEDIDLLRTKKISVKDLAKKYNTTEKNIWRLARREHIHLYKPLIHIKSPYVNKIVRGKAECAEQLGISITSVANALKGIKVKQLEELNITLEYEEKL